ncbi:hypothetical protein CKW00_03080 [Salimicrobium humidisoli]|uniref:Uncharacterized protein n=1 Tax=Salimicrobium humidisoli TaxID=2029857 RepID=A0ABX4HU88_9BACI|nr:hypothetical protein CKW00_03080 [Salimicrobium humidisoli]
MKGGQIPGDSCGKRAIRNPAVGYHEEARAFVRGKRLGFNRTYLQKIRREMREFLQAGRGYQP